MIRIMIVVWSFVSIFLLNQVIKAETEQNFIFAGSFLMLSLYMWIYTVVGIIKADFPTQIKINVQPPPGWTDSKQNDKSEKE